MKKYIKTDIFNNIGVIKLNRNEKLNSLSYQMLFEIKESLLSFEQNEDIKIIILKGGEKAFCVGGDLLEIYDRIKNNQEPEEYYKFEFEVDDILENLKTIVISFWHGMVMGGGVGLSIGSDIKISDQTTKWAMPETRLGMIPDVGVGYYFSKLKKPQALYLSLLGRSINSADLIKLGLSDFEINSIDIDNIIKEMVYTDFRNLKKDEVLKKAKDIISKYKIKTEESLENEKINMHFDKNSILEILNSLEKDKSKWALEVREELIKKCPFSLVTVFYKYEYGKKYSRKETYKKDLEIISESIKKGNVEEGIKSIMIDKTKTAEFTPKSLKDVDVIKVINLLKN